MTGPVGRLSVPTGNAGAGAASHLRLGAYDTSVESGYLPANWTGTKTGSNGLLLKTDGVFLLKSGTSSMEIGNGLSTLVSGGTLTVRALEGTFSIAATGIALSAADPPDLSAPSSGTVTVTGKSVSLGSESLIQFEGSEYREHSGSTDTNTDHNFTTVVHGYQLAVYLGMASYFVYSAEFNFAPINFNLGGLNVTASIVTVDVVFKKVSAFLGKAENAGVMQTIANVFLGFYTANIHTEEAKTHAAMVAAKRAAIEAVNRTIVATFEDLEVDTFGLELMMPG